MNEHGQTYFDILEKIPAEDLERYKRAVSEEEVLIRAERLDEIESELGDMTPEQIEELKAEVEGRPVHKQTPDEFRERIQDILNEDASLMERLKDSE